ncbi:MAG: PIN domain-containing protein [Acidobacteria bacterium]|nr:PIN domain-containing protein [Acidobacteriota bacterium]
MSLGVDTDVLVHWAMEGTAHHRAARRLFQQELERGRRLAIVPQVLHEFLHVATDSRRFEHPLSMREGTSLVRRFWASPMVEQVPGIASPDRICELLDSFKLGRKRIHDTALAATLEAAGIDRLATFNGRDFRIFRFLTVVDPLSTASTAP